MNWLLLNSGKCAAPFNMALDEALLESASSLGKPVLRFYGWMEPAATFGYFQKISEVEHVTRLRPLIRRPTGGGIVPHDADWTYSFVVPPNHEWHLIKAEESYRRIHEWIQRAFAKIKVKTELAPCCKKTVPGQCFEGHEKFDLLWNGKKIAGAAQRRNKLGLLVQGSVQPPLKVAQSEWENAMCEIAHDNIRVEWNEFIPGTNVQTRANELTLTKYSLNSYNRKR